MKNDYLRYFSLLPVIMFIVWTISCSGRSGRESSGIANENSTVSPMEAEARFINMVLPSEEEIFKLSDKIKVVMEVRGSRQPDSVRVLYDGSVTGVLRSDPWEDFIPSSLISTTGRKPIKIIAFRNGSKPQIITRFITVCSDKVPERNGYRVITAYPHDKTAFTQGLFYEKGILYEGTGQETGSTLRQVELTTGKILRQHNLEPPLFGEGITLYNDLIFQVTWQNKVGFVYDKSTFNLVNKIYYQTEGWGLTTVDDKIVMSDGSNILYFIEPKMFTVDYRIEVYDNEKKFDNLNELEFINGEIWANIWMTDLIARIDPATGKVLAYIDLKGILPDSEKNNPDSDVLNGIAFDKELKRIFVTGKNWPRLFEIRITQ
jgi:glutamine cyclotransferase